MTDKGKWNQPNWSGRTKVRPPRARFVAWAAVGVAFAGIAMYALMRGGEPDGETQEIRCHGGAIAEARPTLPRPMSPEETDFKPVEREIPFWERDDTNGFNSAMIRKWKFMRRPKPAFTNDMAKNIPKLPCEIFDSYVENEIAVLMTLRPGASIIGMPKYGEDYEREFVESCQRPIIIGKDDDDYTQQLKKDMIEVKSDIISRMQNGEKVGDIIRASRVEAQRLSQIRDDIVAELRRCIHENGAEGSDAELYYEAANKMLEQHGIDPVRPLSISKLWLRRRVDEPKNGEKRQ